MKAIYIYIYIYIYVFMFPQFSSIMLILSKIFLFIKKLIDDNLNFSSVTALRE